MYYRNPLSLIGGIYQCIRTAYQIVEGIYQCIRSCNQFFGIKFRYLKVMLQSHNFDQCADTKVLDGVTCGNSCGNLILLYLIDFNNNNT